jgi:anti-sigma28 factor (negative regulator of flagellin synthesis)
MNRAGRSPADLPRERAERVKSLRRRIALGEYRVPAAAVADAVLAAWARGDYGPGAARPAG